MSILSNWVKRHKSPTPAEISYKIDPQHDASQQIVNPLADVDRWESINPPDDFDGCEYCGNTSDERDSRGNCLGCGAKRKEPYRHTRYYSGYTPAASSA